MCSSHMNFEDIDVIPALIHLKFFVLCVGSIIFWLHRKCTICCKDSEKQLRPKVPKENIVQLGTQPPPKSAVDDWWVQSGAESFKSS